MELHTERLRLRGFEKGDWRAVQSYSGDPDVIKYMTFGPNTPKETRAFIRRTLDSNAKFPRRHFDFVLEKRTDEALIGACGLYLRDIEGEAEAGWILHKDYWNQGFMTEAAFALLGFGFETIKLRRIYATCFLDNIGSARVMEKVGMRKEGRLVKRRQLRGEPHTWHDELIYAILDEEWASKNTG